MTVNPSWMHDHLDRQLAHWRRLEEPWEKRRAGPLQVITISTRPGSGGKLVGGLVAKTLDLRFYDRNIIHKIAEMARTSPEAVEAADERGRSTFEEWADAILHQRGLWRQFKHGRIEPQDYLGYLKRLFEDVANEHGGVIIGRGAGYILPAESCLRVRVVAPLERRVARLSKMLHITPARARSIIRSREASRRAFIKQSFGKDITDSDNYDIILNLSQLSLEDAAQLVVDAFREQRAREVGAQGSLL